jgi:hypothetical protein
MGYYSAARRTRIVAQIEKKIEQLDKANEALLEATTGVQDYRFDSNEGSQRARRESPEKILKLIAYLEACIDSLSRKLDGTNLVKFNLRRKPGGIYRRTAGSN